MSGVSAIDPSASFVEASRARLPGVDVREGVVEALPYDDDAFDGVLAQLVVHFMTDPVAGLRAMEQILVRCMLHSHRQKLWEPRHRRPLAETAARHDVLYDLLAARDGAGLAQALGGHIDTIVDVDALRTAS
mgnify:CR=1 FL=1